MPKQVLAAFGLLHGVRGNLLSEMVASVMAQMSLRSVPTLLIATFAIALLQKASAGQDRQSAVQSQTLLRTSSSWDGEPYRSYTSGQPELSILKITLAPHIQLEWHSHPMPSAAYIVAGELTLGEKERWQEAAFYRRTGSFRDRRHVP